MKRKVQKMMVAKSSSKDLNLFSFELRKVFTPNGRGICTQLAIQIGLNKKLVSRAFGGKPVTTSVASKIARGLGFEANYLFVLVPAEIPKNDRSRPARIRQYV
jgi:hypothetical protein